MNFLKRFFFHSPVAYCVAGVIEIILVLLVLFTKGFNLKIYYLDAFSIAGAVLIFIGLLILVQFYGAFDTFGYSFSMLGKERKYKSLYDYSEGQKEKRSKQEKKYMPFIVVGGVSLVISLIIALI